MLPGTARGAQGEPNARIGVQTPQSIFLPWRQRLGADRFDVDERDETQHLQKLFAPDERREARDDIRVPGIPPERDPRHLTMVADQEAERFRGRRLQLKAIDCRLREAQALARVAVVAPRADIVQEQREREELGRPQLLQQACESRAGRSLRIAEHFDTPDRQDRVQRRGVAAGKDQAPRACGSPAARETAARGTRTRPSPAAGPKCRTRAEQVEHSPAIVGIRDEIFSREVVEALLNTRADLIRNRLSVDDRGSKRVDPDRWLQRRSVRVGEANTVERDHELFRGLSDDSVTVDLRGHGCGVALHEWRMPARYDGGMTRWRRLRSQIATTPTRVWAQPDGQTFLKFRRTARPRASDVTAIAPP